MRVLVTGGAGFLGGHLVSAFRGAGARVRTLDVRAGSDAERGGADEQVVADVRDPAAMTAACRDVEVVVHAAFASPRQPRDTVRSVNVRGTRTVLEAARARGVRRALVISSTIVDWPARTHPLLADSPLSRLDEYRTSRVEAERIALEHEQGGLTVALVRPKTFLGPGRLSAFALVFELTRLGRSVPVLGDGGNRYQLLDVRDLAEGVRALAGADAGGVFSFGAEHVETVRHELGALIAHAGTGARLRFVPGRLGRGLLRGMELAALTPLSEWHYLAARGADSMADTSRAQRELGWRAARSNIQALQDAYDWYVQRATDAGGAPRTHPIPFAHRGLKGLSSLWSRRG